MKPIAFSLSKFWPLAALLPVIALVISCTPVESQKGSDSFLTGQLPVALQNKANQWEALKGVSPVALDEALTVAVIDNGVDLAHRDLLSQMAYDVENGRIVGAGFDFMGDDRWASPNLINPKLFAFGAKDIDQGRIIEPSEDPLVLVKAMNDQFMDGFIHSIQEHPVLKNSLFRKISKESMSLYGAERLLNASVYNVSNHEHIKTFKELITPDVLENPERKDTAPAKNPISYMVIHRPWVMDATGLPDFEAFAQIHNGKFGGTYSSALLAIEHADLFWDLLKSEMGNFKSKTQYDKLIHPLVEYLVKRESDPSIPRSKIQANGNSLLASAHHYAQFGPLSLDPIRSLQRSLENLSIIEEFMAGSPIVNPNAAHALDMVLTYLEKLMAIADKVPDKKAEHTKALRALSRKKGAIRELIQWYKDDRSAMPSEKAYRDYLEATRHPYLSSKSADSSHGTHVSGIIAKQDPRIRIYPVRVTTESTEISSADQERNIARFVADFKSWLAKPVVFRALGKKISPSFPELDFKNQTAANRDSIATHLMTLIDDKIRVTFEKEPLEYLFMEEILNAIRLVGEKKIKLVNVSLGTNFEKVPASFKGKDPAAEFEEFFAYLKYEFYKFRLGEVIQAHGKNSLFVIASGNDGKWIDGRARSALPVDISSSFLEPFENPEKNEIAPNNHIDNILAVGSIDADGDLSSFTNIPITSATPFILSEGENILSPIKSTSFAGIDQILNEELPELKHLSIFDNMSYSLLEAMGPFEKNQDEQRERMRIALVGEILDRLQEAIRMHIFLRYPEHRARMSGTSMATPAATGRLARIVLEKSRALGVSPKEIHDREEFLPRNLIGDLFEKSELLRPGAMGIPLKKVMLDIKHVPGDRVQPLEKHLSSIIKKGAADNRFTREPHLEIKP